MSYTILDNSTTTLTGVYVWANNTVDGLLGYGILLMIFSMVYFGSMRYGATTSHASLVALVTTTMVCGALTIMGVTSSWTLTIVSLLMLGNYIFTYHN